MTRVRLYLFAATLLLTAWPAAAQDHTWRADVSVGWAGLVDDATKNYFLVGGSIRRYVTPRLSIGPEIVVMRNPDLVTDRIMMFTGNAVFDIGRSSSAGGVVPFVVLGGGVARMRDQVANGPFSSSDPTFTAGGGFRARIQDAFAAGAEYRVGWELHQRLTGLISFGW